MHKLTIKYLHKNEHIIWTVPPKIAPFEFSRDINFGERASVQCVVGTGDLPLTFAWMKDNIQISTINNNNRYAGDIDLQKQIDELASTITIRQNDEFTSALSITKVTRTHDGNYSCFVENGADNVFYSTLLRVNGK